MKMICISLSVRRGIVALAISALFSACGDSKSPTGNPATDPLRPSYALAVSSSNFQQCANGDNGGMPCTYINGVLNDSKSLYHESEVIAERFVIPGLSIGHTYRLVFDYGWEKALNPGHMNYDFLAGWNTTLGALANPCGDPLGNGGADIRAVCNTDNTIKTTHSGTNAAFQVIPGTVFTQNAPLGLSTELQSAITRFQTLHGANSVRVDILGGSFPAGAFDPVTYGVSGDDVKGRFTVRFTAGQTTVMLLWGGHFADSRDYRFAVWDDDKNGATPERQGNLTGAAGQSGAPFQFSPQYLKSLSTGDSTGIGSLSNNIQGNVLEAVPRANISIGPSATNGIGESHTFTVTLRKNLDDGTGDVAAAGEHVDVTLTPAGGAVVQLNAAASTCDNAGVNTNASGQCTMVFTSNSAGTVTGHATATLSLNGTSVTVSTNGTGDNSPEAVKTFIDGSLRWLKHDGSGALLGGAVFTVCRTHVWDGKLNSGAGGYADSTDVCVDVTDNVSDVNNTSAGPTDRDGTGGEFEIGGLILGKYSVTEKTAPVGYILTSDVKLASLSTVTIASATIATAFVNVAPTARIAIAASATNGIGESHTFTVTLLKDLDDGAGPVAAAGEHVSVSLTPANGAAVVLNAASSTCDDAGANTNASGQCTMVFTSNTAGTITGSATATLSLGGVSVTATTNGSGQNSSTVIKTFVAGTLRWLKRNGAGQLLGGAVFTVCRTELWNSDLNAGAGGYTDLDPDVCVDVTDNVSGTDSTNAVPADRDGTPGEFGLGGLILGKYTVSEKTAPAGYILDGSAKTANLSTAATSASIATAFVNVSPDAFITIGSTATNDVGDPHTFTATMTAIPNGGSPVVIAPFTITVSPAPGTPGTTTCDAFDATTNSRTCRRTINSSVAGTFTANASATATVAGITLTRDTDQSTTSIGAGPNGSGPAVKTYVAPLLVITKTPDLATQTGGTVHPGGTASFTITVKNDAAVVGGGTANGVTMTDTLPAGLSWTDNKTECVIDQVTVSAVNRDRVICTIGSLAPQASFSVTVTSGIIPASFIQQPPSPAGSALEIDGDLVDSTAAGKDWGSLPGSVFSCTSDPKNGCDIDQSTGRGDNSFGQGTKEDTPTPSIVAGSIPNNKSDLLRFYLAKERFGTTDFLYLAWSRVQEPNGTTNMDVELNQSSVISSNGVTPVRTAGDILLRYDLAQGGTVPKLGFHRWITSGSSSQCAASNAVPCWGTLLAVSTDVFAAINTVSVSEPIAGGTLSARTFGEASINLQASGIFEAGVCRNFGQAYLKSRSSDAFTSELKDFIAPMPVSVTNCAPVTLNNTAWAKATNFTPTNGNLGDPISDTGTINVTETASASLNVAPTSARSTWAVLLRGPSSNHAADHATAADAFVEAPMRAEASSGLDGLVEGDPTIGHPYIRHDRGQRQQHKIGAHAVGRWPVGGTSQHGEERRNDPWREVEGA
jgi:uncharacterized repeat protein (TIGR01451 family)